jgi:hypothetical protein
MQIFGGMFSKSLGRITINSITSNIINKELLLIQLYYYSLLKPKILQRIIQCSIEINDRRARAVRFQ